MPVHLIAITATNPLPATTGYAEGYPMIDTADGVLYTVQSGSWVAVSDNAVTFATTPATSAHTVADGSIPVVVLADATSGAFDVTMPTAVDGLHVTVKKVDASVNAVGIATPGAELIDGAATQSLASQWDSIALVSDGTDWFVI